MGIIVCTTLVLPENRPARSVPTPDVPLPDPYTRPRLNRWACQAGENRAPHLAPPRKAPEKPTNLPTSRCQRKKNRQPLQKVCKGFQKSITIYRKNVPNEHIYLIENANRIEQ
jgi:hypothetical protein